MKLKPYPEYKDSGVEWLGQIPVGWKKTPIKQLGKLKAGAGFPHDDQGVAGEEFDFHKVNALGSALSDGTLQSSENTISKTTALKLGAFIFPTKTLVFAKVGAALLLGRIRMLANPACIDNNMMGIVVDQKVNDVSFAKYAMNLVRFDLIANPGAVPSINEGHIGNFALAVPGKIEQQKIVTFLDRETGKLDTLISKQEHLIELLQEKRQAIISHAVTKGLNPDANIKDSGVEWLGMVPENWKAIPTKQIFHLIVDPADDDNDFELLSIYTDIGVRPRKDLEAKGNKATTTDGYLKVKKNDFIVNKLLAWMGAIGLSVYEGVTSPAYDILRAHKKIEPRYYDYLFRCGVMFIEFKKYSRGIMDMRLRLYFEEFGQLYLPFPTCEEQTYIADFLDIETNKIDSLIEKAKRSIELAKEHRTALISAAVTGKIDVRNYVNDLEAA